MAIKLTLTLDDKAAPSLKSLADAFKRAGQAGDETGGKLDKVQNELKQTGDAADDAAKKLQNVKTPKADEGGTAGITAVATATIAAVQVFEKLGRAIRAAAEKIKELADQGVPEFERMQSSIDGVASAWDGLVISFGKTRAAGGVVRETLANIEFVLDQIARTSQSAREELVNSMNAASDLKKAADTVASAEQAAATAKIDTLEDVTKAIRQQKDLIEEIGRTANVSDSQRAANLNKLLGLEQQRLALLKRGEDLTKAIGDVEASRAAEASASRLKEVEQLGDINAAIDEQIAKMKELAASSKTSTTDVAAAKRDLIALETRRKEILSKESEEAKKANEEIRQMAAADREFKKQQEHQPALDAADKRKADAEAEIAHLSAMKERRKAASKDEVQAIRDTAEEIDNARADMLKAEKDRIKEEGKLAEELADTEVEKKKATYDTLKRLRDADKKHAEETARRRVQTEIDVENEKAKRVSEMAGKFGGGMKADDARKEAADQAKNANEQLARLHQQKVQQFVSGDVKGFMQSAQEEIRIKQETMKSLAELQKKFGKEGGLLEQVKANITDKDKFNQILENRIKENTEGKELTKGEMAKARRDEFRNLNRDIRKGKVGQDEAEQATRDLTRKTIDEAEKSGKFSDDTIQAMKEAANAAEKNAEKNAENSKAIQDVAEQLRAVQKQLEQDYGASRRKAQAT